MNLGQTKEKNETVMLCLMRRTDARIRDLFFSQKLVKALSVLFFCIRLSAAFCQDHTIQHKALTPVWETEAVFKTPESVLYDAKRNVLYVSNYNVQGGFNTGGQSADEFIIYHKTTGFAGGRT